MSLPFGNVRLSFLYMMMWLGSLVTCQPFGRCDTTARKTVSGVLCFFGSRVTAVAGRSV